MVKITTACVSKLAYTSFSGDVNLPDHHPVHRKHVLHSCTCCLYRGEWTGLCIKHKVWNN